MNQNNFTPHDTSIAEQTSQQTCLFPTSPMAHESIVTTVACFNDYKFCESSLMNMDTYDFLNTLTEIRLLNCKYTGWMILKLPQHLKIFEMCNVFVSQEPFTRVKVDLSCCKEIEKLILKPSDKIYLVQPPNASLVYLEINEHVQNSNCLMNLHLLINLRTFFIDSKCLIEFRTFGVPFIIDPKCSSLDRHWDISSLICLEILHIVNLDSSYPLKLTLAQREGKFAVELSRYCMSIMKQLLFVLSSERPIETSVPLQW